MITVNDLKTKGIKAIQYQLSETPEVIISVRRKVKYVVMTVEQFDKIRLAELEVAYILCKKDIEEGNYTIETAKEHTDRLWAEIK